MPSGRPSPYAGPMPAQQANPWASAGLDPTKAQTNMNLSGSLDFAKQGLNYAAQSGWGRTIDDNMFNQMAGAAKYTGGNVTSQQYNDALKFMQNQWGAQTTQPGAQQPPPSMANVGPAAAMTAFKEQSQVVGVPAAYSQSNPYQQQQQSLMKGILANPQTMGQQQQNQLGEQQKESANRMMAQANQMAQQQSVGSGFAGGGQRQAAQQNQNQQDMISNLLAGRRDIAVNAARTNRQDELNALDASSRLGQQGFENDMSRAAMGFGQINQNRGLGLQEYLGEKGTDLDYLKFDAGNQHFNKQYGLDFLQHLAQKDQFNRQLGQNQNQFVDSMGLNWAQHQASQANNFLNYLYGGSGY
jgi:hypothetical protein